MDHAHEIEVVQSQILEIDLSAHKVPEPLNAYRINEGRFGIANFSPEKPFLITYGLSSCNALALYDKSTKKGALSHISVVKDVGKTIDAILDEYGEKLDQASVYLVRGTRQGSEKTANWLRTEPHYWPTQEQLIKALEKRGATTIHVDSNSANQFSPRGISLNLENGELREIDNSNGWTWSNLQDTNISRWNV